MAIRIRKVENVVIAVCAAETKPQDGDIYLDDVAHQALGMKFWDDFGRMGFLKESSSGCQNQVLVSILRTTNA